MSKQKKGSAAKNQAAAPPLMILTNDRTPQKAQMLFMLYKAASLAQLAYMDGMHPVTGEIHQLLVGLQPTADGQFQVFPLAKIFSKLDEIPLYMVPDGQGSYIDYSKFNQGRSAEVGSDKPDPEPAGASIEERQEDRPAVEETASVDGGWDALGGQDGKPVQRRTRRRRNLPRTEDAVQAIPEQAD